MIDLTPLETNKSLLKTTRYYIIGMADARAELLQQQIDLSNNPRVIEPLSFHVDSLLNVLQILYKPFREDSDYVKAIEQLEYEFKFLSEPDRYLNIACRVVAIEMCNRELKECNEMILKNDLPRVDITFLEGRIKEQNLLLHALTHYEPLVREFGIETTVPDYVFSS